jgi:alanine racemase
LIAVRALATVDLAAIERNVALLDAQASSSQLCAVVKADGYGHGAAEAADAAIRGGATWLAVSTAAEAQELRASVPDLPILVMGAVSDAELEIALGAGGDVVAWSEHFLSKLSALGGGRSIAVWVVSGRATVSWRCGSSRKRRKILGSSSWG